MNRPAALALVFGLLGAAAAAQAPPPPAAAAGFTAGDVYTRCQYELADPTPRGHDHDAGFCAGYLWGIFQATRRNSLVPVCIPADISLGQVEQVVVHYLANHLDALTQPSYDAVVAAFKSAWPC